MTQVFFLHGNPGHTSDWEIIASKLPKDAQVTMADSYSNDWVEQILKAKKKVLVVAHSWGCFRLMSEIDKLAHKIERVFLINPYLKSETVNSGIADVLLSVPVLGSSLIKAHHKKSYADFLTKMIHPQKLSDSPAYVKKMGLLADVKSWQNAVKGRQMQGSQNLTSTHKIVLGFAYFGEQDKMQNNEFQKKQLAKFPYIQVRDFADAGHGMLWSHADQIAKDISGFVNRIGYNAGSSVHNNVISFMENHVVEHGDKVALMWAEMQSLKGWDGKHETKLVHQQITFKQLEDRIARLAQGLLDLGIKKGDRVIIFLPMSVDMYVSMFAVQRIGAIAVFLDSWARSHHLGASAECVGPKAMISFEAAFNLVNQVPEFNSMPIRIMYGPGEGGTHRYQEIFSSKRSAIEPVESEFTALITFTTGSTGKPKGANRTHRFLVAQHYALTHVIPYTASDLDMPAFPIFSLNSLATGVTTLLPAVNLAQPAPTDSALLTNQIINEKVTCTTLSPSMLVGVAKYCAANNIELSGLRRVVTGGAPISKDDVRAFYSIAPQVELWILYGSTEAEPMAHIEGRQMLADESISDSEVVENGVNVGEISEDIDCKFIRIVNGPIVLGEKGWSEYEVAPGEVGEFICTGDHVCRDYYNNTDAFASTKILDKENRVWHRTGDLAYRDESHNLWIVGRVNNAIERQGKYYFPVQAEILLKRMEFASRCAFLGLPQENSKDQQTCAVIELKAGVEMTAADAEKARQSINQVFSKNQIPVDKIKFVQKIPMDPRHHSKVEYAVLRTSILKGEGVLFE
jgi:acyl-CoA synthetase (AMP-forming)/AMP-acid ligase II/pimeloyl-ACP methyl ester carboxylesterase